MKFIITLLFILISVFSFAQHVNPYLGTPNSITLNRGYFKSDSGVVISYNFPDTASANLGIISTIPNIVITANDTLYKRNNDLTAWRQLGGSGNTIYTGDGSLNGDRTVDLNGKILQFRQNGEALFYVDPTVNSERSWIEAFNTAINKGFAEVRSTDIDSHFRFLADFNDGTKQAAILGESQSSGSSITYSADTHTFNGAIVQPFSTLVYGATTTWDMATGDNKVLTLTGDANLVFSNATNGNTGTLIVVQDGSGGHSLTVPDQVITLNSDPGDTTVLGFTYDGTVYYWAQSTGLSLNNLSNVNISSPTNGQGLVYNSSTSKWVNQTLGATVGTAATRLALTPTNGLEFYQTNDARNAPAGKYWYLNGIWNFTSMANEDFWYYFNDFSATSATASPGNFGNLNNEVSGTGATVSFTTNQSMFYGLISTGTATNGYVKINAGAASSPNAGMQPSTMNIYYAITIIGVSQKSDLTNVFNIDAGIFSGGTSNPQTAGYGFRYDSATSANWLYKNGAGGLTSTGVAFAANTAYTLEVFVRSDSVFYWINNSQIAAAATSGGTSFYTPYTRIVKTAGGTACTMTIDYIKSYARLQASRSILGN